MPIYKYGARITGLFLCFPQLPGCQAHFNQHGGEHLTGTVPIQVLEQMNCHLPVAGGSTGARSPADPVPIYLVSVGRGETPSP